MLFIITIVLLVLYRTFKYSPDMPHEELWFMLCTFLTFGYIAGFLDSRIFQKLDKNKGALLNEIDQDDGSQDESFHPNT